MRRQLQCSGDQRFEQAALRALRALWELRTPRNLLGTSLDVRSATWLDVHGGIGASADSFYEYLLKAYVLLGTPRQGRAPPMSFEGCDHTMTL